MAKNTVLGLCTSGSRLKVAVSDGKRFLGAQRKVFNQERELFALVRRGLAKLGSDLRGVGTVCAARGPGRFTGIRIALTLAGSLQALSGAAVRTATLFEMLALQAAESADYRRRARSGPAGLAVLLHAFKDEYFLQFFTAAPGRRPRPEGEPAWLKAEAASARLAEAGKGIYVIADAEEDPGIYGLLPPGAAAAPRSVSKVLPAYVIKAALAFRGPLKPLYLKPAKYELENNVRPKAARRRP
ncbi:MAG: hypothetical protein M0025_07280 [Elusimicrobia bacterium]|nr:hypothetical protein [Elusimicrobiota bacterium]